MKKIIAIILAGSLIFCFMGCNKQKTDSELTEVTVCLDWTPNTNHTGIFVANAMNYYEEAGIKINIVQGQENGATEVCAAGQADFAIDAQDLFAAAISCDTPLDVTAVAAIIQHNTSCIMTLKGSGVTTPSALQGKTYLTWDSPIELAMMKNIVEMDGGSWDNVNIIPNTVTDEAEDITANPDHAIWVFAGWSKINADVKGVETDTIYFKDINETFDYYTPIIVANNDFLENNADLAKAFLSATKKGYEYAVEHPEEAAQMLIDGDETGSLAGSEDLVYASQKWLSDKYIDDAASWGIIDQNRWDSFYAWLYSEGLIENEIPAGFGFTNGYLE